MNSFYFIMSQHGNDFSHDWGGEFYHDPLEAEWRKEELEGITDSKEFVVVKGQIHLKRARTENLE